MYFCGDLLIVYKVPRFLSWNFIIVDPKGHLYLTLIYKVHYCQCMARQLCMIFKLLVAFINYS